MTKINRVGFTGTQRGMTDEQTAVVRAVLYGLRSHRDCTYFHHGDCVGADAQSHDIATDLKYWPIIHPPSNPSKRAWCEARLEDFREPRPYLDRNKDIVRESHVMVAAPGDVEEQLRSGTWSTVRFARKLNREIILVFPDGKCRVEHPR